MAAEDYRAKSEHEFKLAQASTPGSNSHTHHMQRAQHFAQLAVMDRLERLLEKTENP
jgi:hypothetical protein